MSVSASNISLCINFVWVSNSPNDFSRAQKQSLSDFVVVVYTVQHGIKGQHKQGSTKVSLDGNIGGHI